MICHKVINLRLWINSGPRDGGPSSEPICIGVKFASIGRTVIPIIIDINDKINHIDIDSNIILKKIVFNFLALPSMEIFLFVKLNFIWNIKKQPVYISFVILQSSHWLILLWQEKWCRYIFVLRFRSIANNDNTVRL